MRELLRLYLPYKKYLILAIICNVLMSVFMVISIPILQPFLTVLFNRDKKDIPVGSGVGGLESWLNQKVLYLIEHFGRLDALLLVCGFLVLSFFAKNLFRYLSMYFIAPIRNYIVRDIRQKLVHKMLDLPLSYYSDERKGDLLSRATADVAEIEWSIMGVLEASVREPVVIISALTFMVFISPALTLYAFLLILVIGGVIGILGKNLKRDSGEAQTLLGYLVSLLEETLSGLRIIKGFNAENYQSERFEQHNTHLAKRMTSLYRRRDLASPLSEFLGICTVVLLLIIGAQQVFSGEMGAETFITFLYAFYNVIEPAKSFSSAIYSIRKGQGALERVQNLLNADNTIQDKGDAVSIQEFKYAIRFENVSFGYKNVDRKALKNIDFEIPKGKIIALVGASGAGKSTIADLLPRFYDPSAGTIFIDDIDIKSLKIKDLRSLMGIVSQEAILFNDTVRNNILFGAKGVDEAAILAAAKAAHALDFIQQMPEGFDTLIGDRGSKLSGGQRQRLTIARALLKNPDILILDEATSALDSASEHLVQEALEHLMKNRTALVIAHRLSTIQHADEIIVMEKGEIIERGSHSDLIETGKHYKKLVELQAL